MKALTVAEREALTAKVLSNGWWDKEDAATDDELTATADLDPVDKSWLAPDTGYMDSDDITEVMRQMKEEQGL